MGTRHCSIEVCKAPPGLDSTLTPRFKCKLRTTDLLPKETRIVTIRPVTSEVFRNLFPEVPHPGFAHSPSDLLPCDLPSHKRPEEHRQDRYYQR